ncbi:hypothetical protein [Tumidithrix elongata]
MNGTIAAIASQRINLLKFQSALKNFIDHYHLSLDSHEFAILGGFDK